MLPFICDNLFRGTFSACCLDFLWVGLRLSEVGTTTARPALWFGEAIASQELDVHYTAVDYENFGLISFGVELG